ncbi:hypothetical protein D6789_03305 [Candidatus Woesearchaeota archaeon]|nr:MAG: hypothetical protein D6789_03305 [Candidatus Woesearchaeota archaeon]
MPRKWTKAQREEQARKMREYWARRRSKEGLKPVERDGPFPPRTEAFLEERLVKMLSRDSEQNTIERLANRLTQQLQKADKGDVSVTTNDVARILTRLRKEGVYNPIYNEDGDYYQLSTHFESGDLTLDASAFPSRREGRFTLIDTRFGAIANTELGNIGFRDDALLAYYHVLAARGVKTVLHHGDIIAGPPTKATKGEIRFESLEQQAEYLAKNYPAVDGITTYFITAPDCEGKFINTKKLEVGAYLQNVLAAHGREDLIYIGHGSANVKVPVQYITPRGKKKTLYALVHMAHGSGRTPYARSYPLQKMVQSLQGGTKPDLLTLGHFMQVEWLMEREIWGAQIGGFKEQTPSMVNRRQHADVAGTIITLKVPGPGEDKTNDQRFAAVFSPVVFFNREFYEQHKAYRRTNPTARKRR